MFLAQCHCIGVEVVAGQHALVHAGRVEAEIADLGLSAFGRGGSLLLAETDTAGAMPNSIAPSAAVAIRREECVIRVMIIPRLTGRDMMLRTMNGADPAMETAIKAGGLRSTGCRVARR